MKRLLPKIFLTLLGFSILAGVSAKDRMNVELEALQRQWSELHQQDERPMSSEALRQLAAEAGSIAKRYPGKIEPRVWESVITASYFQAIEREQEPETFAELLDRIKAQQAVANSDSRKM